MKKLSLAAMSYYRDDILNALQGTGAAEIKETGESENTLPIFADNQQLRDYLTEIENALETLVAAVSDYEKQNKIKSVSADTEITASEFLLAGAKKEWADGLVQKINDIVANQRDTQSELAKLNRTISSAQLYKDIDLPLNGFSNTAHTAFKLGVIPATSRDALEEELKKIELCHFEFPAQDGDNVLVFTAAHKSAAADVEGVLQSFGFSACPFTDGKTGKEVYNSLLAEKQELIQKSAELESELYSLNTEIRDLKIYCDLTAFELEKSELSLKMRRTEKTFLMEAYVPAGEEEQVKQAILSVTKDAYFDFSEPSQDEIPPTLYKNNAVVKNFETVTNMYSPPSSREFDPSTVMAVFYSIFLGFIMADAGYGLLMLVGGGAIWFMQKRDTGLKRLAGVFAAGGVFAIVWGFLFNSFFGIALQAMPTIMPDPQKAMWSLMGISVPAVLIISLLIGIVQLLTGYVCRAVQCWRRGQVLDGIFDGLIWAVFSLGVALAIVGFVEEFKLPIFGTVGGITAGASLVVAMLTAGRKEKFFGKFTKGFGAAYGVINYASDVLSYARLYGLMLSGAVIAQIVSTYAIEFITGGNIAFAIIGVLLMVIGHAFNLAMSLLGAYIHDARLQYVEFYGRFFEGEGELFTPIGSKHKYVYITPEKELENNKIISAEKNA